MNVRALRRSDDRRIVAGVAAGMAGRLGLDPILVRLALLVLALAGGVGVVAYLVAWLVSGEPAPAPGGRPRRSDVRQMLSVALVTGGLLLLLREAGLWLGDAVVWPAAIGALGVAVMWSRGEGPGRARLEALTMRIPRTPSEAVAGFSRARIAAGAVLVAAGVAALLAANTSFAALGGVAFAVAVTVLGVGVVLGPYVYELGRQLTDERRERVRSQERAEVAAHLHDSVLQTLALIQRASTPTEMVSLARGQERELRAWLYGGQRPPGDTLRAAVDALATRVEERFGVRVEAVVVGDAPMDDRLRALVDATAEAAANAARHSGASAVSLFAEAAAESVTVFVRDEGRGFEPAAVPADRLGIAESIVARMERNGGSASIRSEPGAGTEVALTLPRRAP